MTDLTPAEIPQDLIDILDARAGKAHNRTGPVVAALAEVLTRWEEIKESAHRHNLIHAEDGIGCRGCDLWVPRPDGMPDYSGAAMATWQTWLEHRSCTAMGE